MREGNRLEAKRAKGGLPHSLWETYSSFANTEGGLILLGVSEHEDHSLYITGVDDARNMAQDFWNMVHDPSKVSAVVLSDNDVVIRHTSQGDVISIDIPRAARDCIPVYVGQNPMTGSYRRNGDGDYLCDEETVRAMLRDSDLLPLDRTILKAWVLTRSTRIACMISSAVQEQTARPSMGRIVDRGFPASHRSVAA